MAASGSGALSQVDIDIAESIAYIERQILLDTLCRFDAELIHFFSGKKNRLILRSGG